MPGGKDPRSARERRAEGESAKLQLQLDRVMEDVWALILAQSGGGEDGLSWRLLLGYVWCHRWMEVELSQLRISKHLDGISPEVQRPLPYFLFVHL